MDALSKLSCFYFLHKNIFSHNRHKTPPPFSFFSLVIEQPSTSQQQPHTQGLRLNRIVSLSYNGNFYTGRKNVGCYSCDNGRSNQAMTLKASVTTRLKKITKPKVISSLYLKNLNNHPLTNKNPITIITIPIKKTFQSINSTLCNIIPACPIPFSLCISISLFLQSYTFKVAN